MIILSTGTPGYPLFVVIKDIASACYVSASYHGGMNFSGCIRCPITRQIPCLFVGLPQSPAFEGPVYEFLDPFTCQRRALHYSTANDVPSTNCIQLMSVFVRLKNVVGSIVGIVQTPAHISEVQLVGCSHHYEQLLLSILRRVSWKLWSRIFRV